MPSSRKLAPLEIFQDSSAQQETNFANAQYSSQPFAHAQMGSSMRQKPAARSINPRSVSSSNILPRGFTGQDLHFEPPKVHVPIGSPTKQVSPQSYLPDHLIHQDMFNNSFFAPLEKAHRPTDEISKKQGYGRIYHPVAPKLPPQALFNTFQPSRSQEKDHDYAANLYSDQSSETSYDLARYTLDNHSLSEAIANKSGKRRKGASQDITIVPEPEDMPVIMDEPNGAKPNYSYSQLIGMAILRAPNRRLTLAHIYKWISDTFSYYQTAEAGWMNSIRHNLSLSKSFYKQERPKDDPGKGNYWAIVEEDQKNFVKDKKAPKNLIDNPSYYLRSEHPASYPDVFAIPAKPGRAIDTSTFPSVNDASSDGTVPDMDAVTEEKLPSLDLIEPPSYTMPSSPPPANMNSSPPVARHTPPPPTIHFPSNSRSGHQGHRRKRTVDGSFKDSGFFSSINSSITRPGTASAIIPGETGHRKDNRQIKRGRAEEEIARIRGSSFDPSPSRINKALAKVGEPDVSNFGSSPLRLELGVDFAPLTPGIQLKPPTRAPPTVSPNTHLQQHRARVQALLGTPANGLKAVPGFTPFSLKRTSPAFLLHAEKSKTHGQITDDDFGEGNSVNDLSAIHDQFSAFQSRRGSLGAESLKLDFESTVDFPDLYTPEISPVKARLTDFSAKLGRPALQRAVTASGVLADVTQNRTNRLASPFSFEKRNRSTRDDGSPSKKRKSSFVIDDADALWQDVFASSDDEKENDNDEEETAFDLTKGFGRIGEGKENAGNVGMIGKNASMKARIGAARPAFGRSITNLV